MEVMYYKQMMDEEYTTKADVPILSVVTIVDLPDSETIIIHAN